MTEEEPTPDERTLDILRNRPDPMPKDQAAWEAFQAGWKAAGEARNVNDSPDTRLRAFYRWEKKRG